MPTELAVGSKAPAFALPRAGGGSVALADFKGRKLVLYFYPKAFTQGCTLEAHAFAEATAQFQAAGATVVGMSADDLASLQRFSKEACRDKFAVAIASPQTIAAYDVALRKPDGSNTGVTSRTSYVIGKDGRVKFVHSDMDYRDHVRLTLEAVKALRR